MNLRKSEKVHKCKALRVKYRTPMFYEYCEVNYYPTIF